MAQLVNAACTYFLLRVKLELKEIKEQKDQRYVIVTELCYGY